jgi:hypothetical protein
MSSAFSFEHLGLDGLMKRDRGKERFRIQKSGFAETETQKSVYTGDVGLKLGGRVGGLEHKHCGCL